MKEHTKKAAMDGVMNALKNAESNLTLFAKELSDADRKLIGEKLLDIQKTLIGKPGTTDGTA